MSSMCSSHTQLEIHTSAWRSSRSRRYLPPAWLTPYVSYQCQSRGHPEFRASGTRTRPGPHAPGAVWARLRSETREAAISPVLSVHLLVHGCREALDGLWLSAETNKNRLKEPQRVMKEDSSKSANESPPGYFAIWPEQQFTTVLFL